MIERLSLSGIIFATAALSLGYALSPWWPGALLAVALGILWFLGQRRGWRWMPSAGLALSVVVAAGGMWLGMGAGWMLCGTIAALSAWDLAIFGQRMAAKRVIGGDDLERRHLRRLLLVTALGMLVAVLSLLVRFNLSFGWLVLLGVLLALAMGRAVALFRRESD